MARRKSRSDSQGRFAQIPQMRNPRSVFNRSHGLKTTFDSDYLVPIYVDEALPGDTHTVSAQMFARMATPLHPIMDHVVMAVFFFAIPLRILWTNMERFFGAQDNPTDSTDFVMPKVNPAGGPIVDGSLEDYFGLPLGTFPPDTMAMVHRAYNKTWNEHFRDQNLQDSVEEHDDNGPDPRASYTLLKRGKRHDYITSCLPWIAKTPNEVTLPLGQVAPVVPAGGTGPTWDVGTGTNLPLSDSIGSTQAIFPGAPGTQSKAAWNTTDLEADLSLATAATISQIREAFQVQKLYERDARGGTRFPEVLEAHFGVTNPDHRMQRPEYLGGGNVVININPVAQTSETTTGTPQGNLAAIGVGSGNAGGFTKSFTEPCIILGLASVRSELVYQQRVDRMWRRNYREDFFWPAFQHLSEQPVRNDEVAYLEDGQDAETFGFQERYGEYRYKPSQVTGRMRSFATTPLHTWHLAQNYITRPNLNAAFIESETPIDRVVAVPSEPEFLLDAYFNVRSVRPMAVYGVPGKMDHF